MAIITREEADALGYEYCRRNGCMLKDQPQIKPKKRCGACHFLFHEEDPSASFLMPAQPQETPEPLAVIETAHRTQRIQKKHSSQRDAEFGAAVRRFRGIVGISQDELSKRCDQLIPWVINEIEEGRHQITPSLRKRLAKALDVPLELLERKKEH